MAGLEAVDGVQRILLWRLKDDDDQDATKIALQTEHDVSSSKDVDSRATKDGSMFSRGQIEQEISSTFLLEAGTDSVDKMKEAHEQDEIVSLWDVDMNDTNKKDDKYKSTYYEVDITDFEESTDSEDAVEVSLTMQSVGGIGQRGYTAVNAEQEEVIQYVFREAVANSGSSGADE